MEEIKYYPNPAFRREIWQTLNGKWEFTFDDKNKGISEHYENKELDYTIQVPFVYQCKASEVKDKNGEKVSYDKDECHPIIWYRKSFDIKKLNGNEEVFINFNAVDHYAMVFINGHMIGTHTGGYTPFSFPISAYLKEGENTVALRIEDYQDPAQMRGKQIWTEKNWGCWYTASSGIWQDVYLTVCGKQHITSCMITPDLDNRKAYFEIEYSKSLSPLTEIEIELTYENKRYLKTTVSTESFRQFVPLQMTQPNKVDDHHAWCPERPSLFDVKLSLKDENGNTLDTLYTYFGMRKMSTRNGQILLNNRPVYQRLILDQGYWEDTLLTPPSPEALQKDLELTKAMGFNGIRKHQKFESPYYYYLASKMGLLVWAEIASPYYFSTNEVENITKCTLEAVKHLYNHPSIITWVPFNESWGVRDIFTDKAQQTFVQSIYYLLKTMDKNRLISGNDGWEQVITDFSAIHDYDMYDEVSYYKKWKDKEEFMGKAASHRQAYAEGFSFNGEPILLTEFGGVALEKDAKSGAWGYRSPARNEEELLKRIRKLMETIYSDKELQGFCYTQLTDVMQEVNGLLYIDRTPKCDVKEFEKLFNMYK